MEKTQPQPRGPVPTHVSAGGGPGGALPNHTVTIRGRASVRASLHLCVGSGCVAACAGCVGVSVSLPGARCPRPGHAVSVW